MTKTFEVNVESNIMIWERTVKFTITSFGGKDDSDYEIVSILRRGLDKREMLDDSDHYYSPERSYNFEPLFIQIFTKRSQYPENTSITVNNYHQRKGSLIIEFTLLIIGTVTNYGTVKNSISDIITDTKRLFNSIFDESGSDGHFEIDSTYHDTLFEKPMPLTNDNPLNKSKENFVLVILLTFLISIFSFFLYSINLMNKEKSETSAKDSIYIEYLIDKKIEDALYKQKIDLIYNDLKNEPSVDNSKKSKTRMDTRFAKK